MTSSCRIGSTPVPPLLKRSFDRDETEALKREWEHEQRIRKLDARQLLLKQPHWYQLVGLDRRTQDDHAVAEMSPEARKVAARRARKSQRRKYAVHGPAELAALLNAA